MPVYSATKHSEGSQHGNSRQERKRRPWRNSADRNSTDRPASSGWCSYFPIQPRTTCPGMALPTVSYAVLYQLVVRKNAPQMCPQASLMGAIPQLRCPLPSISS